MATHVAANPTNPTPNADSKNVNPEHAGASYAHAVLNFRQVDSKEDIKESNDTVQQSANKVNTVSDTPISLDDLVEPMLLDDGGGGFTPVVSHSRKERKNERNKKNREAQSNKAVNNIDKRDNNRENNTREQLPKEPTQEKEKEKEEVTNKKVFVEAPLPTVNPWQRKTLPNSNKDTEKRVPQPQKQQDLVNGQPTKSYKEKKKNNQKVNMSKVLYF